ncbi:hypothetical protein P8452_25935 [Trifolium repens]|nr:hypothetical protein P8452_25935 [Trifolium repens]
MWIVLLLRSTITVRGDFAIDIGSQEGTMVGHDLALSCLGWLGLIGEFSTLKVENPSSEELQSQWRYTIGLLAVIFAFRLIVTTHKSRRARSWQYMEQANDSKNLIPH